MTMVYLVLAVIGLAMLPIAISTKVNRFENSATMIVIGFGLMMVFEQLVLLN